MMADESELSPILGGRRAQPEAAGSTYQPQPGGALWLWSRPGDAERDAVEAAIFRGGRPANHVVSSYRRYARPETGTEWVEADVVSVSLHRGELVGTKCVPWSLVERRLGRDVPVAPVDALAVAAARNPSNPFVRGCHEHFQRSGGLSPAQVEALLQVDGRVGVHPRRRRR